MFSNCIPTFWELPILFKCINGLEVVFTDIFPLELMSPLNFVYRNEPVTPNTSPLELIFPLAVIEFFVSKLPVEMILPTD